MGKRSFVIYDSWATMIANIPTEQAGELIQAICAKRLGKDVAIADPSVAGMFAMIAPQLEADSKKYQEKCDRIKAAREKIETKNNESESELKKDESALKREKSELKKDESGSVSDSVSVSESVYDSDSENDRPSGEKEKNKARSARPVRHKHGKFGHVMLSDDELKALNDKHGENETQAAIEAVDKYCEKTGKKYKNYKLVLEDWGYSSAKEKARGKPPDKANGKLPDKPTSFNGNFHQREYDYDELEKKLLEG